MVIEAGSQPTIRLHFTRDRDRARRAVFDLEAHDQPNHLSEAIRTALALVPPVDPRVRVHVLTDGAFDPAQVREFPDPRVRWVTVGGGARNVGITQFAVRKAYYGAFDYQAFLSVTNFSDERVSFPLALTVDDQKLSEQTIALDPLVKRNVIVPFTLQGGGGRQGRRRRPGRPRRGQRRPGGGAGAAEAPRPPGELRQPVPGEGAPHGPAGHPRDEDPRRVLRAAWAPSTWSCSTAPRPRRSAPGRFVLVNSTPGDVPIESLGTMEQPIVLDWARNHPVMRFVDLSKVAVEEALRVRPLAAGKTLLESVGGPLIFLLEEPQRKAVFVGFDLFKTDLPLRVAFPLILANSLRWLQPVGLEGSDLMVAAGSPFLLAVEHGVQEGTVRDPSGATHRAEITRGALSFAQTDRVGPLHADDGREAGGAVRGQPPGRRRVEHPAPAPAGRAAADGGRGGGQLHVPARAVAVPPGPGDR